MHRLGMTQPALVLLLLLLAGCGSSPPAATSLLSARTLRARDFQVSIPSGWTEKTLSNLGADGVLYGISSTAPGVPEDGVAPAGVMGVEIAVIPVSSVPSSSGDVATMTPAQLVSTAIGVPAGSTKTVISAPVAASLGGDPAATETLSYTDGGIPQRDLAIALRHGADLYLVSLDTTAALYARGTPIYRAVIASWHWSS